MISEERHRAPHDSTYELTTPFRNDSENAGYNVVTATKGGVLSPDVDALIRSNRRHSFAVVIDPRTAARRTRILGAHPRQEILQMSKASASGSFGRPRVFCDDERAKLSRTT